MATFATAAAAALLVPAGAAARPQPAPCDPACRILVNSEADAPDAHPGDHVCATGGGSCTLRAAVQEANALTANESLASKVLVPEGDYVLTRHGLDDTADRGDLDLHFIGQVIGAGQSKTLVDGDDADRVFDLFGDMRVSHLAVRHGRATDGPGGGIRATGFPNTLDYLYVTDNEAVPGEAQDSGRGGGIAGFDLHVFHSYVAYNDAEDGAGMWWHGAQSSFRLDTFQGNHATRDGGAIFFDSDDSFVSEITVSGNRADGRGGGIFISSAMRGGSFEGSTIASNSAPTGGGGGIYAEPVANPEDLGRGARGLIVARNGGADCAGPTLPTSFGGNLDSDGSCGFGLDSDRAEVDPALGSLKYNGGPTPTRALDPASPAVDIWDCSGVIAHTADQRGATRPQQETCDAGAYEVGSACCPPQEPPFVPGSKDDPTVRPTLGPCGFIFYGNDKVNVMIGGQRRNEFHGRAGDDRLFGRENGDCLYGELGNDFVQGGPGSDKLYGGHGKDTIDGGDQEDLIEGGPGNDRILGGSDDDRIRGGHGDDYIRGGSGFDTIDAGYGDDTVDATRSGLDAIDCGPGDDTVRTKSTLLHLYRCEHVKLVR